MVEFPPLFFFLLQYGERPQPATDERPIKKVKAKAFGSGLWVSSQNVLYTWSKDPSITSAEGVARGVASVMVHTRDMGVEVDCV